MTATSSHWPDGKEPHVMPGRRPAPPPAQQTTAAPVEVAPRWQRDETIASILSNGWVAIAACGLALSIYGLVNGYSGAWWILHAPLQALFVVAVWRFLLDEFDATSRLLRQAAQLAADDRLLAEANAAIATQRQHIDILTAERNHWRNRAAIAEQRSARTADAPAEPAPAPRASELQNDVLHLVQRAQHGVSYSRDAMTTGDSPAMTPTRWRDAMRWLTDAGMVTGKQNTGYKIVATLDEVKLEFAEQQEDGR